MQSKYEIAFGLKTAIRFHSDLKIWNGYVGVPKEHPLYGMSDDDLYLLRAHGGITWSEDHVPGEEPDGLWWFGFDTAHYTDVVPGFDELPLAVKERVNQQARELIAAIFDTDPSLVVGFPDPEYRDAVYVAAETAYLASQLAVGRLLEDVPE
jgi:hypothetical protein